MKTPFWLICVYSICVGLAQARVEKIYETHCASCHGSKGTGGLGGAFQQREWKYTETDEERAKVIAEGLPDLGMEGYADKLSEQEIQSLVVYLNELQVKGAVRVPSTPIGKEYEHGGHRVIMSEFAKVPGKAWGMDQFADGSWIVTDQSGPVRLVSSKGLVSDPIKNTPNSHRHGQGGMMAVTVHPEHRNNGWVYLGYTRRGKKGYMTKVSRGRISRGAWTDEETIFDAPVEFDRTSGVHFGTRIVLHDGYLWFPIGDRGAQNHAQDLKRPNGKMHRLHDDGRIPNDNPFLDRAGAMKSIWSYGHRNPQGLARDPETGQLWSAEHGPRGGDEVNLVQRKLNYGWPVISYGMNYNGTPFTGKVAQEGMEQPAHYWVPSPAVCALEVVRGPKFSKWQGNLLVSSLKSQTLFRLSPRAGGGFDEHVLVKGLGRIRDVKMRNDGAIMIIVEGRSSRLICIDSAD